MITATAFVTFLAIVGWAYSPSRKDRFERDARLPFDNDADDAADDDADEARR